MWRHHAIAVCVCALGPVLAGCSSINSGLSTVMADVMPEWAGGLPAGAPPRPGDPRYEEFMRAQEAKRIDPKEFDRSIAARGAPLFEPASQPAPVITAQAQASSPAPARGPALASASAAPATRVVADATPPAPQPERRLSIPPEAFGLSGRTLY